MKIEFLPRDCELFFSMVGVYKIYGKIADKLNMDDLELPISTVDLLIKKLTDIIIEKEFYTITYEEYDDKLASIICFMLGTGMWLFSPADDLWSLFYDGAMMGAYVEISKEKLFAHLLENGIEI